MHTRTTPKKVKCKTNTRAHARTHANKPSRVRFGKRQPLKTTTKEPNRLNRSRDTTFIKMIIKFDFFSFSLVSVFFLFSIHV